MTTTAPAAPTPTAEPAAAATATSPPATAAPAAAAPSGEPGSPGVPPVPVPAKTVCDPAAPLSFSYDARDAEIEGSLVTIAHASGDRAELGCATLTEMWQWLQTGPEGVPTVRAEGVG